MNILEKEIEDLICDCLDKDSNILRDRGLSLHPHYVRQLDLGSYGRADIVAFYRSIMHPVNIHIQVIELKKDLIDASVLMQAISYCKGIERILDEDFNLENHNLKFDIILIGKEIQKNGNFSYFTDFFSNLKIYTYNISIDKGITFKLESGYAQSNEMRGCLPKKTIQYIKSKVAHTKEYQNNYFKNA